MVAQTVGQFKQRVKNLSVLNINGENLRLKPQKVGMMLRKIFNE
tara:strand:+ start:403 stop:534 length:132 start_codon:yes stop_codon:yes gene_type:complete